MSEDLESTGERSPTLEELIAKDPERPRNGQITNRMLRNLQDPEYHDPVTAAIKEKGGRRK